MAIVNCNTGQSLRFENGGQIMITSGSDDYSILDIVEGSGEIVEPDYESIMEYDRGLIKNNPIVGDQQAGSIKLTVKVKKAAMTASSADLRAVIRPADTNGARTTYTVKVRVYDYRGTATYLLATCTNCYLPRHGAVKFAGRGQQVDTLEIELAILGTVTWTQV